MAVDCGVVMTLGCGLAVTVGCGELVVLIDALDGESRTSWLDLIAFWY